MADVDPSLIAVIGVAGFFTVWYFAGHAYSRRLARRIGTELKGAVLGLGGTSRIQWFGTTAFRMTTEEANPPFRAISVTVTMRPREMPINWAIATGQGRRDVALVEASLRKDPEVHFELVDPLSRIGRRRSRAKTDWATVSLGTRELLLSSDDERKARRILREIEVGGLEPISALHVTSGSQAGIAASMSVEPGRAAQGLAAIRGIAERVAR